MTGSVCMCLVSELECLQSEGFRIIFDRRVVPSATLKLMKWPPKKSKPREIH